jgi:uncharacterized repeat protein (TIGR01451 family)
MRSVCLFSKMIRALPVLIIVCSMTKSGWAQTPRTGPPVTPRKFQGDVRQLPKAPLWRPGQPVTELPALIIPGSTGAQPAAAGSAPDPVRQQSQLGVGGTLAVTPAEFANANPNFAGIGATGFQPPDTNADIGPNHIMQSVNVSFAIWDKQGNLLAGPTAINQIWAAAGDTGPCGTQNAGDPYVVYDHLADRWVISQFARMGGGLRIECIAVSQTANPVTGGWHLYTFDLGFSNDYPKIGVWPDGYYMVSQRGYNGNPVDATVFDRASMLNGAPATFQSFAVGGPPTIIMLPSDLDGPPPVTGTPNFYVRPVDGDLFGGADRIEIREFHVDWGNPANSSLSAPVNLTPAPFSSAICDGANLFNNCIDQPSGQQLEALSVWPMGPLQYRNFGTHETLVFNHTVDVDDALGRAGVRWYELRRSGGGAWTLFQQGTFSPDDNNPGLNDDPDRWMGSIAMDSAGNMALGYSASSATLNPGVQYTGRLATDPLGLMPTGEFVLQAGASSQIGTRWGDYSTMRVDPVDGCTFWYSQQFGTGNTWGTQIGAFRFPSCNPVDLVITKADSPDPVTAGGQLTYTVQVRNIGAATATNVVVTDTLPAGVVFLSSSIPCPGGAIRTCSLGTLLSGATASFTIQVRVPANLLSLLGVSTTNLTNTVSVTSTQADSDPTTNTATATTNVVEAADLRVTKTCKPDSPAAAGTSAFCQIAVTNLGLSDAQGVILTDVIVSNSPFTISSITVVPSGTCAPASIGPVTTATITCNLGTEPAGQTSTIQVNFTASGAGDVNDTASVSSTTTDPDQSNNQATGQVHFIAGANLSISKTGPASGTAGGNITYTMIVGNAGPSTATGVLMSDTLPPQTTYVSYTASQGTCSLASSNVNCTLGNLASGGSITVTITVKIKSDTLQGAVLANKADVSSAVADTDTANNSATAFTTVNTSADLSVVKTSDSATYKPSTIITYKITVTNNGLSNAREVKVIDTLPAVRQAQYLSDTGGCVRNGTQLECNLGSLAVGATTEFFIKMTVRGSRGDVVNVANVSSATADPVAANNTSTRIVVVSGN